MLDYNIKLLAVPKFYVMEVYSWHWDKFPCILDPSFTCRANSQLHVRATLFHIKEHPLSNAHRVD